MIFLVDFGEPLVIPSAVAPAAADGPSEEAISMILDMGFTRPQALKALHSTVTPE